MKAAFFTGNGLDFGVGDQIDIQVPADLDQLGRDNSHRAFVGGKGLVQLCHPTSDGRPFFEQMDVVPRIGEVQGCLHAGNPTADHQDRTDGPISLFCRRHTSFPLILWTQLAHRVALETPHVAARNAPTWSVDVFVILITMRRFSYP